MLISYNKHVLIPSARLYCKYKMNKMDVSYHKPQEIFVLKIQFNFDISNINISNTNNILKWGWDENHSFLIHLYYLIYLEFWSISKAFLSCNNFFYIMWFHCIPSMYLHSLQSFNILITVYIYKKKIYECKIWRDKRYKNY